MNFFLVMLTGHGLQLRMENSESIDAGFVKNEFIFAKSVDEAIQHATQRVRSQLQQQAQANGLIIMNLTIDVEEIAPSMKFWKLWQKEGFVFFPLVEAIFKDQTLH